MLSVFIIDDEKLIREGLTEYIDWNSLDLKVIGTAGDGDDGLKQILVLQPDIVVCDIQLPLLSGLELLQQLRLRSQPCQVILISAYSEFSYAQEALRYGAFDYILKPIEEDALTATVRRCRDLILSQASANESLAEAPETPPDITPSYKAKMVSEVLQYANQNYSRDICLEEVSLLVNMSVSHFSKIFKEETGETFSKFIYRLRMEKAKELICNSNYKIYEIAEMVGYSDISHFSKKFKEFWGYSPAHLR